MYNHRLDTFICSADAGSFNKAAEEMYITPSAVIKQINLLEASLGVKLFIRNHRGLILTESGKSLYRDAKYIIRFCGEAASIVYGEYLKFQNGQFEDWWVDDEDSESPHACTKVLIFDMNGDGRQELLSMKWAI